MIIKKIIHENKTMVYSAVVAILAGIIILVFVHKEVDRFIFIMPIFAGWILFNILMLPEEENGVEKEKSKGKTTS